MRGNRYKTASTASGSWFNEKNKEEIEKLHTGLAILETKAIGLDKLKQLISEVIERNSRKTEKAAH